jgi:formyl-CoA transferase/CoA:oxalate CoA-transferase
MPTEEQENTNLTDRGRWPIDTAIENDGVPRPLEGIKVLDFTLAAMGPICTQFLADMGADVIKLEPIEGELTRISPLGVDSTLFVALNRNKKSLTVNVKEPRGLEIVLALAKEADVIVENFRPGVMKKIGLDYDVIREINSRIIYCSMSCYGDTGPLAHRRGADPWAQAFTGVVASQGSQGGPPYLEGSGYMDSGGAFTGVGGICAALFLRERTGVGQKITLNLTHVSLLLQITNFAYHIIDGLPVVKGGRGLARGQFPYGAYTAKDGDVVTIFGQDDDEWRTVCKMLDMEYLLDVLKYPQYATAEDRRERKFELYPILDEAFSKKTRAEWAEIFRKNRLRVDPCLTYAELVEHPQFSAVNPLVETHHPTRGKIRSVACPVNFKGVTHSHPAKPAPIAGEHCRMILNSLGYSEQEIDELNEAGIINIPTPDMFELKEIKMKGPERTKNSKKKVFTRDFFKGQWHRLHHRCAGH